MWRRSLHEDIGYFDEKSFGTSSDWEFWLRAAGANKKLDLLDLPLGFYLIDSKSHNRKNSAERIKVERNILLKHANIEAQSMEILIS